MVSEAEMIPFIKDFLVKKRYTVYEEVRLIEKTIDVVGIHKSGELIAVEAKVERWKEALSQAYIHRLWADRPYIAMWHEHAGKVDKARLRQLGVGLIDVSAETKIALKAKQSRTILPHTREELLRTIERIGGGS